MANQTGKSYLLNCAPEIRNIIYGFVLSYDDPIIRANPRKTPRTFLALLQVSKSVERDAAPIFYKQNLFRFICRDWEWAISSEHGLDVYNEARAASRGLSSYDDAQMTCPVIDVPKRYINSLRNVSLIRELPGQWSNGPLGDYTLEPKDLEMPDLENAINFLAARSTTLNSLSITLKRMNLCDVIHWDPDPSSFLWQLDTERRISTAVGKFANLARLDIWKTRVIRQWPKPLKVPCEWTAVQPEALNRVKVDHFPTAKEVLYTRRAEIEKYQWAQTIFCIAEEFLIDFQQTGVEGRKLEYPSELEHLGVDDSDDTRSLRLPRR